MENHNLQVIAPKGRGAPFNPPNRFEPLEIEFDPEWLESDEAPSPKTKYYIDTTRDILSKNDSPDIPFTYGLNPYRGCEHGCVYCYARPTHEYLGFSAGLDFESKIIVKPNAPELLAKTFRSGRWQPQVISLSGNTDCYQPIERQLKLTRRCLEVFLRHRNPVGMITKSALITRDIDILQQLAELSLVATCVSVTTLNNDLASKMEPRAAAPARRLAAIEKLARAGIPVGVNVAPIIPGLNDKEIPAVLKAAAEAGARHAGCILLRLPHSVKDLFQAWLKKHFPERAAKIMHAIMDTRSGYLSDPRFGSRMRGEGERAETIFRLHRLACEKYGLNKTEWPELTIAHFRRRVNEAQGELFG
jgi:DNA repair photolyase